MTSTAVLNRSANTNFPAHLRATGVLAFALIAGVITPADHLAAAETRSADSAPKLLSTVGSKSETWSDVRELEAAAAKGSPRAEAALGELLLRGDGLPRDDARALALLEKSARAGHGPAAFRLGFLLSRGENGAARDPARAIAYFRAAAAAGEPEAFFNLGAAHASGRGLKRDYAEALAWLTVAKRRGADNGTEASLRQQLGKQTSVLAKAERRVAEIEAELKNAAPVSFLPPMAPLDEVYDPLRPPLRPN
jgi:TPR repeat protein